MKVRFLEATLAEIDQAMTWYSEQSPELPERILAEIQNGIRKLSPFPEIFRPIFGSYRRISLAKFPYALFFRYNGEEVVFVAFFHLNSDPEKWHEVLKTANIPTPSRGGGKLTAGVECLG